LAAIFLLLSVAMLFGVQLLNTRPNQGPMEIPFALSVSFLILALTLAIRARMIGRAASESTAIDPPSGNRSGPM
jgi:hypothetical protein